MKTVILLLQFSLLLLSACSYNKSIETERITMEPTIVYDSIESRMPGTLMVCNEFAIWTDPLTSEDQAHIVNLKTQEEIGKIVNVGNGPKEFITPAFSLSTDNELIVYDMNNDKMAIYAIDDVKKGQEPSCSIFNKKTRGLTRLIKINNDDFVSFDPQSSFPFQTANSHSFGKYPFGNEIDNNYNVSQGNIAYNADKNILIYSTISFPYMAAYKKEKDKFELLWEQKGDLDYSISENKIVLDKKKKGSVELALTKDYIVTLQRDYQTDPTNEVKVGRDFTKLPQTLFLYDYKSNLRKIVNLGMPVLRIAADIKNNTVYAIVVNPDFMIVKCELPD